MSITTLVLTRKPNLIFSAKIAGKTLHGRFGTLLAFRGSKITKAEVNETGGGEGGIKVPGGLLSISTEDGSSAGEVKRFTTIERMDGRIQLAPQEYHGTTYKSGVYGLTYQETNPVVIKLAASKGHCFRIRGTTRPKEDAILIHAAPNVGWLEGCIGPRRWNDFDKDYADSTYRAMDELIHLKPSALYVVDW
jgi:hypothetical protein